MQSGCIEQSYNTADTWACDLKSQCQCQFFWGRTESTSNTHQKFVSRMCLGSYLTTYNLFHRIKLIQSYRCLFTTLTLLLLPPPPHCKVEKQTQNAIKWNAQKRMTCRDGRETRKKTICHGRAFRHMPAFKYMTRIRDGAGMRKTVKNAKNVKKESLKRGSLNFDNLR